MENKKLWDRVLVEIELNVSKATFATWFKNTAILKQEDGIVFISVPNQFVKEWLYNKYHKTILKILRDISENVRSIEYLVVKEPAKTESIAKKIVDNQTNELPLSELYINKDDNLNPRYIFDSFVVGSFNDLAFAAAQAVIKKPGISYNPLFIYGGVGLGKTHLMQAVGHNFLQANPRANVLYVSCEKFTNDYVNSIKNQRIDEFKRRYRNVEMLLMDDVQFIAGKEQTQEEFFHTFNEIRDRSRQIILTADRQPKDIPGIEQRLISRFEWGMVVDIQPPNFEMRLAIINSKVAKRNAKVDQEVLGYIAEQIQSNVRELEGVLNRLLVYQDMNHCVLNLGQTKEMLENLIGAKKKTLTIKKIASLTAEFYNVTLEDLIKQSRRKEFVTPRQMAMYLSRKELGSSLPVIGDFFGGRDHTTVLHAVEKLEKEITGNKPAKQQVDLLVEKLYNS
jgi:chromosomal replication initiator protein